jgi:subtilisin-like proprotein convertase family protein
VVLGLALTTPEAALARRGALPASRAMSVASLASVPVTKLHRLDAAKRLAEDAAADKSAPLRYAIATSVSITPYTDGRFELLADGSMLWRVRVDAPGATDLNFGFTRFDLPRGARLHVMSEQYDYYEGPFTAADGSPHGQLWTAMVPGDRAVIELHLPADGVGALDLELTHVGRGYRDVLKSGLGRVTRSGSCNNDVVCPEADPWRDQIRSVAVYSLGGSWFCTGTLIMDVPGSFRSFFLTADHCGMDAFNAPSMVVFWNFESPTCGKLGGGSLADNQTGATWLAGRTDVDMSLLELDDPPDPSFAVYYSGWDRSGNVPSGSVGIHHPSTDEKAISFNDDPLLTIDNCIGGGSIDSHWQVDNWEDGTTERGSSGSGLWDPATKKLVGFLSGGSAACSVPLGDDCYGKFSEAWDGPDASSRLRDWLDPAGTGAVMVDGADPQPQILFHSMQSTDLCAIWAANENGTWEPGEDIEIDVTLRATGDFTGISGTLSSSNSAVTVLAGAATWPDIDGGATGVQTTPFLIRLDETATCFAPIDLDLQVVANEDGPFDLSFSGTVGNDLVPDVPLAIPDDDPAGIASTLDVSDDVTIGDVDVRVQIAHTWVGDLRVSLVSAAATEVVLLDRPGTVGASSGCSDDDMDVTFDDGASFDLEPHCAGTTPWYAGAASPAGDLSTLAGEQTAGQWSLVVSDRAGADTGAIVDWELIVTPPISGSCFACGTAPPTTTTTTTTLPDPCGPAPMGGCRESVAGKSQLQIKPGTAPTRSRMKFKYKQGAATLPSEFGDPVGGAPTYHLCVWDESASAQPLLSAAAPAGGTCGSQPCWKATAATGYRYKNKDATPDGIDKIRLKADGSPGRTLIQVQARGALLSAPAPPLTPTVTAQLLVDDGGITCWEVPFTTAVKNDGIQFKAKGP